MADQRFARVSSDPRFKKIPRKQRKVKIDSRFKPMFSDKRFTTKYFVDKRGAVIGKTSKETLHQFYDLSDEEDKSELKETASKDSTSKLKEANQKEKILNNKEVKSEEKIKNKRLTNKTLEERKDSRDDSEDIQDSGNDDNDDQNGQSQDALASNLDKNQSSDEEGSKDNAHVAFDFARGEGNLGSSSSDDGGDDDDDDKDEDNVNNNKGKHKGKALTSYQGKNIRDGYGTDSDDDDDDDDELQGDEIDHQWAELDSNINRNSNTSRRLAVCNLDWDKITASDLFVVFSSLKTKGCILSIKIYPSEFGLERLKNEECFGPEELIDHGDDEDNAGNNVEGSEFSREKLRQYQINRLKYYYAVIECDCAGTASCVYNEYDGVEYELSGNLLDLRFIPDDMMFEHEPISVAMEMPTQATYEPPRFETTALHQTNVKLTWDETDTKRVKSTMKAFTNDELHDMDFKAYLASSSDEGDEPDRARDRLNSDGSCSENEDERIAKYKKLVQEIDAKDHQDDDANEMEITWEPGLQQSAHDLVARKQAEREGNTLTAWEKYLNKKKEKKKERRTKEKEQKMKNENVQDEDDTPAGVDKSDTFFNHDFGPDFPSNSNKNVKLDVRKKGKKHLKETEEEKKQKEELELLLMDENKEKQHFSLKGIIEGEKKKKKRKKRRQEEPEVKDDFSVNVDDSRFTALYSSHLYAIDPSDPQYKKTKAMNDILEERQRRRTKQTNKTPPAVTQPDKKGASDPSLSLLVKSVKSKTGEFNQRRKKRKTAN